MSSFGIMDRRSRSGSGSCRAALELGVCVFERRPRYVYIPHEWREKARSVAPQSPLRNSCSKRATPFRSKYTYAASRCSWRVPPLLTSNDPRPSTPRRAAKPRLRSTPQFDGIAALGYLHHLDNSTHDLRESSLPRLGFVAQDQTVAQHVGTDRLDVFGGNVAAVAQEGVRPRGERKGDRGARACAVFDEARELLHAAPH